MSAWRAKPNWVSADFVPGCGAREPETKRGIMFVRLRLEESRDGLVATISEGDADGKITGPPMIFLVRTKEEAKRKASAVARGLGLTTYRIIDKSRPASRPTQPMPDRAL
jgi:hypothetical protein